MPTLPRRSVWLLASLSVLIASGCTASQRGVDAGPSLDPLASIAPSLDVWTPVRGESLEDPPQRYPNDAGVLRVTLRAEDGVFDVAGSPLKALLYDGSIVGPTLHLAPGDTLEMSLRNEMREATNIHFHGLHVSPSGIADNVFRTMPSGSVNDVRVDVPADQPPGLYWYHAHLHGSVERQTMGGLSGLLIVDGLERLLPDELRGVKLVQLALRDVQVGRKNAETTSLVNGLFDPTLAIAPGETQLWRVGNIGANTFYDLQLPGHVFTVIAEDGFPVWETWEADHLVLPPGKRFEVLVTGGAPGSYALRTNAYDQGAQLFPKAMLATVQVQGSAQQAVAAPPSLATPDSLARADIANERTFSFTGSTLKDGDEAFLINGEEFDMDATPISPTLGTVEEWTLKNDTDEQHAFHLHTNSFQVMRIDGADYEARGRQDVVVVPARGEVVIRSAFEDFTGEFVFECHIARHTDAGMMRAVTVVP